MNLETFLQKEIKQFPNINFVRFTQDYLPFYLRWFKDPLVLRHLNKSTPQNDIQISRFVNFASTSVTDHYYIINLDNEPIGHTGLKNIDYQLFSAELSCVIGEKKYIGQGVGLSTMVHFIKYVLTNYPKIKTFEFTRLTGLPNNIYKSLCFKKSGNKEGSDIYTVNKIQLLELLNKIEK